MKALMLAGSSVKISPWANIRISQVRPGAASIQLDMSSKKVCLHSLYTE